MNILANLPSGFFAHPSLVATFDRLRAIGELRCTSHNTADEIRADLATADAVIMWSWPKLTTELLNASPRLRYRGHIDIDQESARIGLERGVPISISRAGWSPAVAEMALTLMLSSLRRTSVHDADMHAGTENWVRNFPVDIDIRERQLTGRTVGIVGFGRIGRRLGELLQPFNVTLPVADPFVGDDVLSATHATRVGIDELCRECEVIVLCAAANDGTQHLLNADRIGVMRPNAVLVNVARASLVETNSLIARLRRGDLIAAIDVFDTEPLPADSPLRRVPNLHLTPHRAGGVMESVQRCVGWLVDDLDAVLRGRTPVHALTAAMVS